MVGKVYLCGVRTFKGIFAVKDAEDVQIVIPDLSKEWRAFIFFPVFECFLQIKD